MINVWLIEEAIYFKFERGISTTYLRIKILVQDQGGFDFLTAGILEYSEDLKIEPTQILGQKIILRWFVKFMVYLRLLRQGF